MKSNKLPQKNNKTNFRNNSTQNKIKRTNNQPNNSKINNKYGFDIYDKKNAREFNKQFLGLNNANNSNGIYVGEGIFNMDLPMHKPGEIPDFSNPYGNNFFNKKEKGIKLNPRTQPLEYLQNFFGGFGIEFPVKDLMNPPHSNNNNQINKKENLNKINKNISSQQKLKKNVINNKNKNQTKTKIKVHRHEFDKNIFNQNYITNNEESFRENYCSNFRSNLEKEVFDYLMSLINGNRVLSSQQKQIPIKTEIFNKLNKIEMSEKYMKKNGDIFEPPFCCICLANIDLKQKGILLPCGHLFHFKCAKIWLEKNSVCPMCRLDLNEYFKFNLKEK